MPYPIKYCTHAVSMDRLQLQQHQPIEMSDIGITIRIVPVPTGQRRQPQQRRPPTSSFASDDDIGYDTTAMTQQLTTQMMTTTNTI